LIAPIKEKQRIRIHPAVAARRDTPDPVTSACA